MTDAQTAAVAEPQPTTFWLDLTFLDQGEAVFMSNEAKVNLPTDFWVARLGRASRIRITPEAVNPS